MAENTTNNQKFTGIVVDDGSVRESIRNRHGDEIGVFYFRPTDIGIIDRYNKVAADFDKITAPLENVNINADGTEVDTTKTDKRVNVNGVMGLYLESKINGARLFFSCSGGGYGRSWNYRGSGGLYWSSTWSSARNARSLNFYSGGVLPQYYDIRYLGFALRPVQ